jgi:hypothetical protein
MEWFTWTDLTLYPWIAGGAGGLLLLALICYFLPVGKAKIPAAIVASVASLGLGVALGVVGMAAYGYRLPPPQPPASEGEAADNAPRRGPGGPPGGMMGMMMGGPGGMRMGPPSAKVQLATLVEKLELLTSQPIKLELSDEQSKTLLTQLDGLDAHDVLKDEDAKKRLDTILKLIEGQKKTLAAVGFNWPGEDGPGPGGPRGPNGVRGAGRGGPQVVPNPFRDGAGKQNLQSLHKRLAKGNEKGAGD